MKNDYEWYSNSNNEFLASVTKLDDGALTIGMRFTIWPNDTIKLHKPYWHWKMDRHSLNDILPVTHYLDLSYLRDRELPCLRSTGHPAAYWTKYHADGSADRPIPDLEVKSEETRFFNRQLTRWRKKAYLLYKIVYGSLDKKYEHKAGEDLPTPQLYEVLGTEPNKAQIDAIIQCSYSFRTAKQCFESFTRLDRNQHILHYFTSGTGYEDMHNEQRNKRKNARASN